MSTEPDYNFNEPATESSTAAPAYHLPLALISSALAVFLFAQTSNAIFTRDNLKEAKTQVLKNKADLADAYHNREPVVKQAMDIQKKLQDMLMDLLLLSKTDDEAKAIVTKYNIQQGNGGSGGDAPAPAP
jgi:hypothetical protein